MLIASTRLRHRRGFSLIELMLVLSVLGIVASVSVGKLHEVIVQQRVARASTAVQSTVETAFAIAIRNHRPIRISWSSAAMRLDVTDAAGTTTFRSLSLGGDAYSMPTGSVTVSRSPLEVYPNGLAADTLSVAFIAPTTSKRVRVSRAGLVQVCASAVTRCSAP